MSNFTPLVNKEYIHGDDTVTVSFARFKRKDMLNLMPLVQRLGKAKAKKDDATVAEVTPEILNLSLGLLPEYVKTFTGLRAADGEPISIETVAEEMYFIDLASDIAMDIMDASIVLQGKGPKNL